MSNANNSTALATGTVPAADREVTVNDNKPLQLPKLTDAEKEAIDKTMKAIMEKVADVVDQEVNGFVVKLNVDVKEVEAAPFRILKWAMTHIPADKLAIFPKPGSDTGNCPDKYEEVYFRDGKKKFRQTSFYLRWFLSVWPEGKRLAAALAHVALAKDEKANQAAVPENIRAMNPVDLESFREDLVKQQNKGVKGIRDAFALLKQFEAVNKLPKVAAEPSKDADGNVQKVAKPIKVWNTDNPDQQWGLYSLSGFMQFDPDRAAELGGTFDALKLTAKRDTGDDGQPNGNETPVAINTNGTFVARINDVAEYVGNKLMADKKRELYGQFLKDHIATADSGDLIYNLNELKLFIDGVMNIPVVQSKLEEVTRKRNAA